MKRITLIDKAFVLKATSLFDQLDLELLLPIADKLSTINCKPGDAIFSKGEEAHRMYIIVKGTILMRDPKGHALATIGPQDYFGDESLFGEQTRGYTAICQSDCLLLALSLTHLLTIISECPNVAISLLNAYASTTPFRQRKLT